MHSVARADLAVIGSNGTPVFRVVEPGVAREHLLHPRPCSHLGQFERCRCARLLREIALPEIETMLPVGVLLISSFRIAAHLVRTSRGQVKVDYPPTEQVPCQPSIFTSRKRPFAPTFKDPIQVVV